MDKKYICCCGLYCENCAVKARVEPAAQALRDEMKKAGFKEIVHFLRGMAEDGVCLSCKQGSGNPGCTVRICAQSKGVEACALCSEYPCEKFARFFEGYPVLERDNALLRDDPAAWAALQDERRAEGFTYADNRSP